MSTKETIEEANKDLEYRWALLLYALHNLKMQARQDVAEAIFSVIRDTGPREQPSAATVSAARVIRERLHTATLIATKIGHYTYTQLVEEHRFENGLPKKVATGATGAAPVPR